MESSSINSRSRTMRSFLISKDDEGCSTQNTPCIAKVVNSKRTTLEKEGQSGKTWSDGASQSFNRMHKYTSEIFRKM